MSTRGISAHIADQHGVITMSSRIKLTLGDLASDYEEIAVHYTFCRMLVWVTKV